MMQNFAPRVGQHFLTDSEAQDLAVAGFGGRLSQEPNHPALLIIDATQGFCGNASHPSLAASVAEYPHSCGPVAWNRMPNIRALVDGARERAIPTIFTRPRPAAEKPRWHGRLDDKNSRRQQLPSDVDEIVTATGFVASDILLDKDAPSAFFGTPLIRWLRGLGVNGVVICGVSTSGCVRATAVDAFSFDFETTLVLDATFDRITASHEMTLLDFELKYGDVRSTVEVLEQWRGL